jgi:hypothetical protein
MLIRYRQFLPGSVGAGIAGARIGCKSSILTGSGAMTGALPV